MNTKVEEVNEDLYTLQHNTLSSLVATNGYNIESSFDDFMEDKSLKILKNLHSSSSCSSSLLSNSKPQDLGNNHHQSSSRILSFENVGPNVMNQDIEYSPTYLNSMFITKKEDDSMNGKGIKRAQPLTKTQSIAQEHIIAERKRREKLTQRFVALSALLPGLKKMDKASVLGDAVKHIKYLQERVKEFEEQNKESRVESIVLVKRSKMILDDTNSLLSYVDDNHDFSRLDLPEIEVRFAEKDVQIKILCEKQKGHVAKIMNEIENLGFSIINSSVLHFGPTLDITVIAQKEENFDKKFIDVMNSLRFGLSKFM